MASRTLILCLAAALAGCQMPADTVTARYLLSQGNTAEAQEQLRQLAEAGDAAAQVEYGKLLAGQQNADPSEALQWYQRAWQQQDYRAGPASLRLFKRYQGSLALGEARARELLVPLRPQENPEHLRLALSIAALYPGAATDEQWQRWLHLYRRSCVVDCYFDRSEEHTSELQSPD